MAKEKHTHDKHEHHEKGNKESCKTKGHSEKSGCLIRMLILVGVIIALILLFSINSNVKDIKASLDNGAGMIEKTGTVDTMVNTGTTEQGEPVKGEEDAPVTITEWSDFECPFCSRFYEQTYSQIVDEYVATGKVKFVFRNFPLSFHQNAQKAAEASECAGEQGKFWEMHDKLFEDGVTGGVASFKQYAADIGLNTKDFNSCLDSGKMADEVANDMAEGGKLGVTGTPGFIINGQLVSGAQPFSAFKAVIDAELAK